MRVCPVCGVTDLNYEFEDNMCRECYLINKRDNQKHNRLKSKIAGKHQNLLEATCEEATSKGLTYAQYQIMETQNKLKRE